MKMILGLILALSSTILYSAEPQSECYGKYLDVTMYHDVEIPIVSNVLQELRAEYESMNAKIKIPGASNLDSQIRVLQNEIRNGGRDWRRGSAKGEMERLVRYQNQAPVMPVFTYASAQEGLCAKDIGFRMNRIVQRLGYNDYYAAPKYIDLSSLKMGMAQSPDVIALQWSPGKILVNKKSSK